MWLHQGKGDGHPLLLPTGDLAGEVLGQVGEADIGQHGINSPRLVVTRELSEHRDVLPGGQRGDEVKDWKTNPTTSRRPG
jgi:hypothetical protein